MPRYSLPVLERPKTRADCVDGPRPCPWASCKYNLAVLVRPSGGLTVISEDLEDIPDTCTLDVADRAAQGELVSRAEVAKYIGKGTVCRERVRQIEVAAIASFKRKSKELGKEFLEHFSQLFGDLDSNPN